MQQIDDRFANMSIQAFNLNVDDDVVSICDRLDWARESQVLLVLPPEGDLLTEYVDLVRLRRAAERHRITVGLVTADSRVVNQARALHYPIFSSAKAAASDSRKWRRGRAQPEYLLRPQSVDDQDRKEVKRRKRPPAIWLKWLRRYAAVFLFFVTIAVLYIAAITILPGATVTFYPEMHPLAVSKQIVADPQLQAIDYGGSSVPGRVLSSIQSWSADVVTTGQIDVADAPARGKVVFVNLLDQPIAVPAGTRVSTTAGTRIIYQTSEDIEIPGSVGATQSSEIIAVVPGPGGNVEAGMINRVEGRLSLQLQVRNIEPTNGGAFRTLRAVTEDDVTRLQSQVMKQLELLAMADMESQLDGQEFLAEDSLKLVDIIDESYSQFPGEQSDRLQIEIRAQFKATAVDKIQANGLLYEALSDQITPGFELIPDSFDFQVIEVIGADNDGRVTFVVEGRASEAAILNLEREVAKVAGQELGVGRTYLFESLPLRDYPRVVLWPGWNERFPLLSARINIHIDTQS